MFERYTEKARRSIFFARYEASQFGSPYIESEHLLLGITREDRDLFPRDVSLEEIRNRVESSTPRGPKISVSVDLPLSQESRQALELGAGQAERLKAPCIDTKHLLLGLIEQERCFASAILRECGVTAESLRATALTPPHSVEMPRPTRPRAGYMGTMLELFAQGDEKAREVYVHALQAARKLGSPCLETKHLLLGLLDHQGTARFFTLSESAIREAVKPELPRREKLSTWSLDPTEECRQAMAYAMEEARLFGLKKYSAEHLLLGLLREESCEAAEILRAQGFILEAVRKAIGAVDPPQQPRQ